VKDNSAYVGNNVDVDNDDDSLASGGAAWIRVVQNATHLPIITNTTFINGYAGKVGLKRITVLQQSLS